jgi:hypothetical protein
MSHTVTAGLPGSMAATPGASVLKSVWARMLLTIVCTAVIWAAWGPLTQRVPSLRIRVLLVLFVAVAFIWKVWPGLARGYGNFQARLILTIIYGVLILPFGVLARIFADPLRIKKRPTAWIDYPQEDMDMHWAKRQ